MKVTITRLKKMVLVLAGVMMAAALLVATAPARAIGDDSAATFKTKCAPCHGADGSGQTPVGKNLKVRDLRSAEVQKLSDAEITKVLTDGKGKMPASKLAPAEKLTDWLAMIRAS